MQTHTTIGLQLVESILGRLAVQNVGSAQVMRNIVELHHEAWDGSGYPHGMRGDDIPLEAQVVSVADVFDALTSVRPYKEEWAFNEAFAELDAMEARGKFRPGLVDALRRRRTEAQGFHDRFVESRS